MNKTNLPAVIPKPKVKQKKKKDLSAKQKLWQKRSKLFWRLKGMVYFSKQASKDVVTENEMSKLEELDKLIKELNKEYTANSIKLGFNAKYRCWCGKEAKYKYINKNEYYCENHNFFDNTESINL